MKYQGVRGFYRKPITFLERERTFPILDTKFPEDDLYPQRPAFLELIFSGLLRTQA